MNFQLGSLLLLIAAIPMGISVQYFAILMFFLGVLTQCRSVGFACAHTSSQIKSALIFSLLFLVTQLLSSLLNQNNPHKHYGQFIAGYFFWVFFPVVVASLFPQFSIPEKNRIKLVFACTTLIWGTICLIQFCFPWRLEGITFVSDNLNRAHGFYSHPMSLGYAVLLWWPLCLNWLRQSPADKIPWIATIGICLCILTCGSRMIQALSFLLVLWHCFALLRGIRGIILAFVLGIATIFAVLKSPTLSHRFLETFNQNSLEKVGEYSFDRQIFWHVHWLMVQEKPILGHGINLDLPYRIPYYERIGQHNLIRKFEAHNMFLQILAQGGLVALLFFFLWLSVYLKALWQIRLLQPWVFSVGIQTILVWVVASMTQNSFQDAVVRYSLTLLTGLFVVLSKRR